MIARRLCGLSVLIALTGCQALAGLEQPSPTRYLQRDLTVAWPDRHYWQPPLARSDTESWPSRPAPAAPRSPPAGGEVARPPAAPPGPAGGLACRRGAC